ncbi:hypothetical protein [Geomonas propionica]|uniref:Uncharacterized protein n=1 Tax=Geomonas propionica TaxID=2798582 RepID=A0ABS0YQG9_9BACT|nr:hypothetical protein [Geomonas propionica]MBJ6800138.1 hypothetical protein [Geomonas propionica]
MKKKLLVLMAVSLFAAATPVLADEANHGSMHKAGDAQCEKECAMLIKDCNNQVDSIQDRIRKLQVAINEQGASTYTVEELKILKKKLQEANDTLRVLNRH